VPWEGAWVVGENTNTQVIPKTKSGDYQDEFEKDLINRKWIQL
jgi:hypothetical protein